MTLPKDIVALLDGSGMPWSIEQGRRHAKLYLAGRFLTIFPRNSRRSDSLLGRAHLNVMALIRHAIRNGGHRI